MRIAILSDLHGNRLALNAVLDDAEEWEVQEYWCLGDLVGYGPEPFHMWQRLMALNIPPWGWVAGNHDWGLVNRLDEHSFAVINGERFPMGYFRPEASKVMALHKDALREDPLLVKSLEELPVVASPRVGTYLTHGRFMQGELSNNVIQYTYRRVYADCSWQILNDHPFPWGTDPAFQVASDEGWGPPRLMLVGHTHEPVLWRRNPNPQSVVDRWERLPLPVEDWLALPDLEARPVHINPGSVGQPRDYSTLARYALLEWNPPRAPRVFFRQVAYEYQRTQAEMHSQGYPEDLIDMLGPKGPA